MNKVPLKTLCRPDAIGKYGIPASAEEYSPDKTRYLRITDIDDYGNLLDDDKKSVSSNDIEKYILDDGDIVFARTGNSTGRTYFHENKNGRLAYAGFLIKYGLDPDRVNQKYLKYYTISKEYKQWVKNLSVGSTRGNINAQTFADLPVVLPTRKQQDSLVTILSVLDDKIELNRRMNAELEQMAHTLYDYWFVQFDFPRLDGKPYKSSGGPMKTAPTLNRQIPEGWEVGKLEDIISRSGTGLNPRTNFKLGQGSNYYVTIKNVENGKIVLGDKCDKIDNEALKIIQKRSDLQKGDILFTSIQPVGVTYFIHEKPTNWNINESVFTIRPNIQKVTSEYLYMLLSSEEMKVYTANSSSGSVHKGIRHAVLKEFKLVLPPRNIIDDFSRIISPILRKMHENDQQSQKLAELRDWLLPMLMNGQIKVHRDVVSND